MKIIVFEVIMSVYLSLSRDFLRLLLNHRIVGHHHHGGRWVHAVAVVLALDLLSYHAIYALNGQAGYT